MNTKHTAGTWYAKDGQIYPQETGITLALIPYFDATNEEHQANQKLIEAAPKLLQTLKKINAQAKELLREDTILSRVANSFLADIVSETELAISEATGKYLVNHTTEVIIEQIQQHIVEYFGNAISSTVFINRSITPYLKLTEQQEEEVCKIISQYQIEWDKENCDSDSPSKEQDARIDAIIEKCANEIADKLFNTNN